MMIIIANVRSRRSPHPNSMSTHSRRRGHWPTGAPPYLLLRGTVGGTRPQQHRSWRLNLRCNETGCPSRLLFPDATRSCPCVCALVLPRALTAASPPSGKDVLDKPGLCFFSLLLSADELLLAESGPVNCAWAVPCRCALPLCPAPPAPASFLHCPRVPRRAGGRLRRCLMEEARKERSTRGQRVDW